MTRFSLLCYNFLGRRLNCLSKGRVLRGASCLCQKARDTIAAISTPLGEGAIGIVRVSGRLAFAIADKVFRDPSGQRQTDAENLGEFRYGFYSGFFETGEHIDEALAIAMPAP